MGSAPSVKKFALSLLAILLVLWLLDLAGGAGMSRLFHSSPGRDGDVFGRAFATRSPIVAVGSSRVEHHYVADTLSAELGVPVYNLGQPRSWGASYQAVVAHMLLRHYTPRLWILEMETGTYAYPEVADDLRLFAPYAREDSAAAAVLDRTSRWERVKRLSHLYPYNSLLYGLVTGFLHRGSPDRRGFVPLTGTLDPNDSLAVPIEGEEAPRFLGQPPPDPRKWAVLRRTVATLKARGVEVVAVRSPYWPLVAMDRRNNVQARQNLAAVCRELGIRYFDFSAETVPAFRDPALFRDTAHLNERGALVFSRALADSIRGLPDAARILSPAP